MNRLVLLIPVCALILAACGPDPIVGKWSQSTPIGEVVMEFKADGTTAIDTAAMQKSLRPQLVGMPQIQQRMDALKNIKSNWKKEGSLYKITQQGNASAPAGSVPAGYAKVEGDRLIFCSQDGTPLGNAALQRKK